MVTSTCKRLLVSTCVHQLLVQMRSTMADPALFPGPILRPHPRLHVTCSTEKHRGRPTKFYSMSDARKDGKRICAASNGKPGEGLLCMRNYKMDQNSHAV